MKAQSYYESLINQGYDENQAKQYTLQYYPDFTIAGQTVASPEPMLPPPEFTMPLPVQHGEFANITSVDGRTSDRKKMYSIVLVAVLIVAGGTAGVLYALGIFGQSDADFVGEWVSNDGTITSYDKDGEFQQYGWSWTSGDWTYTQQFDTTTWEKSGDEVTVVYKRKVTNDEFPHDEETKYVFEIEIIGDVMFQKPLQVKQIYTYEDGFTEEQDMMNEVDANCFVSINKAGLGVSGQSWDASAHDAWYSTVNSVKAPSWCDNDFVNDYVFSFEKNENFFELTLEHTKWDRLKIENLNFYININGGEQIKCFYDGFEGVCSYIPLFGSSDLEPGSVIGFGKGQAWDTDCSSGCDIKISIVESTDDGLVLVKEFNETNLVWDQEES